MKWLPKYETFWKGSNNMRAIWLPLLFIGATTWAKPPLQQPKQKKKISTITTRTFEQQVLEELNKSRLQTRIIKVHIKTTGRRTKVFLTWHPYEVNDIAHDTFLIVQAINKLVPLFYSISLRAIHPKYLRWSGHVVWDGIITRKAFHLKSFDDAVAQPLYQ